MKKMTFYYKGQKIRSSESHIYTHAVVMIKDGKVTEVIGCRADLAHAQSLYNERINYYTKLAEHGHNEDWKEKIRQVRDQITLIKLEAR